MARKKRKSGLNPRALEDIRAERKNPSMPTKGPFAELEQRYLGYDTNPRPVRTVEDMATDLGFTYDELFGDPTETPAAGPTRASATSSYPQAPRSAYYPGNPPPPSSPPSSAYYPGNPPPPNGGGTAATNGGGFFGKVSRGMDKADPYVPTAMKAVKAAFRPSPYAPMTWIEHQMSSEGRGMLYGRGPQIAPLYGIETRPYQIQPRNRRSPEEVFTSPWHDPNMSQVSEPGTDIGYPAAQPNMPWGSGPMMSGVGNSPAERLHRQVDLLHENTTGTLWGSAHDAATGNIGGDVHTRMTRGVDPSARVQPIRAPKPEN